MTTFSLRGGDVGGRMEIALLELATHWKNSLEQQVAVAREVEIHALVLRQ